MHRGGFHKDVARLEVEHLMRSNDSLGASTGVKKAIRKQILYIFVELSHHLHDLMVDVVSVVKNLIMGYSNQLDIIPSIILYIVTIFLLLPRLSNIINGL